MPSISPSGMARLAYSGRRLASILNTTLTGPPSVATKSNSLSILSSTSSDAAITNTDSIGTITSRAMYLSVAVRKVKGRAAHGEREGETG